MAHSDSVRVIGATAIVAGSIVAVKTLVPAIPLSTTVMAAIFGLALIFLMLRSDALRRKPTIEPQPADDAAAPDGEAIRHRLETRPLPQISAGPLSRGAAPVLELTDVIEGQRR